MSYGEIARGTSADEIVASCLTRPGVLGAYVVGSATRSYRDEHSDLDIVVVVHDEPYAAMRPDERYRMGVDPGPPRRKAYDLMFLSRSLVEGSAGVDQYCHAHRHARILHDPSGQVAEMLRRLGEMSPEDQADRMRVHYYEYIWHREKALKCLRRGDAGTASMVGAYALHAVVKCLFVAEGMWPPKLDWALAELRLLAVPGVLVDALDQAFRDRDANGAALKGQVDAWLSAKGHRFHKATAELTNWIVIDERGLRAMKRWGR